MRGCRPRQTPRMLTQTLNPTQIVIDFDSTFTKVEGLDELAQISLAGHNDREAIVQQIRDLTDRGMNGEMPFAEGLRRRIELLSADRSHIELLVDYLRTKAVSYTHLDVYKRQLLDGDYGTQVYFPPVLPTLLRVQEIGT